MRIVDWLDRKGEIFIREQKRFVTLPLRFKALWQCQHSNRDNEEENGSGGGGIYDENEGNSLVSITV